MSTLKTRKTLSMPARICEACQLEADTLYNNAHGAQLYADCIEGE